MAITAEEIRVLVGVETKKAIANLKKFDKELDKTEKSSMMFSKAVKGVFTVAMVAAVGRGAKALIDLASDAEETRNKFNVVFRDIKADADSMARNLADNYGLSQRASQQLLSDTGDLLTGFGFTQRSALELSGQVNKLAVDLASFTNFSGGAEGASAALTKALLGERESIKSLGIAIMEADIKQLAEDKGITGTLSRQTKAALTLELAIKQSQNAIGDFERSQDSFANTSRITKAQLEDMATALGERLLPVAAKVLQKVNDLFDRIEKNTLPESQRQFWDLSKTFGVTTDQIEKMDTAIWKAAGDFSTLAAREKRAAQLTGEAKDKYVAITNEFFGTGDRVGNLAKTMFDPIVKGMGLSIESFMELTTALGIYDGVEDTYIEKAIGRYAAMSNAEDTLAAKKAANASNVAAQMSEQQILGNAMFEKYKSNKAYEIELEEEITTAIQDQLALRKMYQDKAAAEERKRQQEQKAIITGMFNGLSGVAGDYYSHVQGLGEESTKKQRDLARAAFYTQKAVSISQAAINGAVAATKAYSQLGVFGAPAAAFIGGITAAQVGLIAAQKPAFQFGGSFTVPPGSPGDSANVGGARVNQGEQIDVTPVRFSGGNQKMVLSIGGQEFDAYIDQKIQSSLNSGRITVNRSGVVRT